jgi:hypothetical protein
VSCACLLDFGVVGGSSLRFEQTQPKKCISQMKAKKKKKGNSSISNDTLHIFRMHSETNFI